MQGLPVTKRIIMLQDEKTETEVVLMTMQEGVLV